MPSAATSIRSISRRRIHASWRARSRVYALGWAAADRENGAIPKTLQEARSKGRRVAHLQPRQIGRRMAGPILDMPGHEARSYLRAPPGSGNAAPCASVGCGAHWLAGGRGVRRPRHQRALRGMERGPTSAITSGSCRVPRRDAREGVNLYLDRQGVDTTTPGGKALSK